MAEVETAPTGPNEPVYSEIAQYLDTEAMTDDVKEAIAPYLEPKEATTDKVEDTVVAVFDHPVVVCELKEDRPPVVEEVVLTTEVEPCVTEANITTEVVVESQPSKPVTPEPMKQQPLPPSSTSVASTASSASTASTTSSNSSTPSAASQEVDKFILTGMDIKDDDVSSDDSSVDASSVSSASLSSESSVESD